MPGLKDIKGLWENAEDSGYVPVPDGEWPAVIKEAGVNEGDKGVSAWFKLYFPSQNQTETAYFSISSEKSAGIFKRQLNVLQVKAPNVLQLPIALQSTEGWTVTIEKSTNGKYRNYRFVSVEDRGGVAAPATKKEDKLPF